MLVIGHKDTSAKADEYSLDLEHLCQHILIAGSPVSGKTNSCLQLLEELSRQSLPFLVIDTQGKSFRKFQSGTEIVKTFSICDDVKESLRFNPLRTEKHVRILAHIQSVVSLTTASFNLSVTASKVLEKALYAVYTQHGWNLFRNKNSRLSEWSDGLNEQYPPEAYPTFLELFEYIQSVTFANLLGGNPPQELVRAIDSLVAGSKGAVFNTKAALPDYFFEDSQVVVECENISDIRDKCLFVSMLLIQVLEHYQTVEAPGIKRTVVIDDAIHLTYLMGLPGRRVGDDQKEDRWIALAALLASLRRASVPVVVSMQSSSKLSQDLIALFGTRIFHRLDVQQVKQIVDCLPNSIDEEDLNTCPIGSAWVSSLGSEAPSLVHVPKHEQVESLTHLSSYANNPPNCRFSGCSSFPDACDDNTFEKAREIAESQAFRTVYVNYFLSCQKDLTQLVHFRGRLVGELQSQIGRKFSNIVELSWCTICQATEWYFDKMATDHGWPYEALLEQKELWLSMLRPAFLPEWPTRRINIDDLRAWREAFWTLKERDQGPLPLCGECECKCRFGSDVEHILRDPRNENDFFKALSGETEPLSKAAAWFCWLFSERVMGEPDFDLAYCFAAHFLGRANLSVDAQLVFAHKTRTQLEEAKLKTEQGEPLWQAPAEEESAQEKRRKRIRERRKNRPDEDPPPLKPVP